MYQHIIIYEVATNYASGRFFSFRPRELRIYIFQLLFCVLKFFVYKVTWIDNKSEGIGRIFKGGWRIFWSLPASIMQ